MAISLAVYVVVLIALYVAFPRQIQNIFIALFYRKSYVDVWFKRANTEYVEKWLVVPPADKETKIRKGMYNLSEIYAINKTDDDRIDGKRAMFFVDEKDNIPRIFEKGSADEKIFKAVLNRTHKPLVAFKPYPTEDIVFQAQEFQRALQVRVDEFLFTKKPDKMQTWLLVALFIMTLMAIYEASVLNKTNAYLDYLAAHMNQTIP